MESPLRVGIMSTAFIGKKTIQAIGKAAGAEVVGVASRSLEKAEAFAKEQGTPSEGSACDHLFISRKGCCRRRITGGDMYEQALLKQLSTKMCRDVP